MRKNEPDDVYRIVSELDRSERRYFKRFSHLHQNSSPDYLKLYNYYKDLKSFSREKLLQWAKKQGWSKSFMNKRNLLKRKILAAMRPYGSETNKFRSSFNRVTDALQNFEFFKGKGLIDLAQGELQSAKKLALEGDLYETLLHINEVERRFYHRYFQNKKYQETIKGLESEQEEFLGKLKTKFKLSKIHDELLKAYRLGKLGKANIQKVTQESPTHILDPHYHQDFTLKKYCYKCLAIIALARKNHQEFNFNNRQLLNLYREYNLTSGEHFGEYCRIRSNFLDSLALLGDFGNEFAQVLEDLEKDQKIKGLNAEDKDELMQCWLPYKMRFIYNHCEWEKAREVIDHAENYLKNNPIHANRSRLMTIKMNLVLLLFAFEDWTVIKKWLEKITSEKLTSIRPDFVQLSFFLNIIIAWEMGDVDDFEKQYYARRRGLTDFLKKVRSEIGKINNLSYDKRGQKKAFKKLVNEIITFEIPAGEPDHGISELYFWALSRYEGKSLHETMVPHTWPPPKLENGAEPS